MSDDKCYFSSGIDESLTCSKDGRFDNNGFPIIDCPKFPCDKYKDLVYKVAVDRLKRQIAALAAENERLLNKVIQLESWQESLDSSWDVQEVGKLLNVENGVGIREQIAPGITNLIEQIDRLTAENQKLQDSNTAFEQELEFERVCHKQEVDRLTADNTKLTECLENATDQCEVFTEEIKSLVNRDEVLGIVDSCFHCYASSFRSDAKIEAQELFDSLIAKHGK